MNERILGETDTHLKTVVVVRPFERHKLPGCLAQAVHTRAGTHGPTTKRMAVAH